MNLLIVDDNAAVRRLIAEIVMPFACEIRECPDGAHAVAAYETFRPDVVFMDIQMVPVDGLEATRRIRAADPSARIIIVTDYDDDALRQAAKMGGASGYALKENLLDLIGLIENMRDSESPPQGRGSA